MEVHARSFFVLLEHIMLFLSSNLSCSSSLLLLLTIYLSYYSLHIIFSSVLFVVMITKRYWRSDSYIHLFMENLHIFFQPKRKYSAHYSLLCSFRECHLIAGCLAPCTILIIFPLLPHDGGERRSSSCGIKNLRVWQQQKWKETYNRYRALSINVSTTFLSTMLSNEDVEESDGKEAVVEETKAWKKRRCEGGCSRAAP